MLLNTDTFFHLVIIVAGCIFMMRHCHTLYIHSLVHLFSMEKNHAHTVNVVLARGVLEHSFIHPCVYHACTCMHAHPH